jgi:hypothetical protein
MQENKIIAAILTVAYNSAFERDVAEPQLVMRTYEGFRALLEQKDEEEAEQSIPERMKPLINDVRKKAAARQKRAS